MARRSRVTGDKEVARAFRELAKFVGTPANQAARHALRPMLRTARQLTPKASGELAKSLAIRRDRRSGRLNPLFLLGAAGPARRILHLVEWGRRPSLGADGTISHPGTKGARMLTRAYDSHRDEAVKRFGEAFVDRLIKRAQQLGRRR